MFVLLLYSGFGVILGHNFPFYMKFKGGKGIAASAGMITSLAIYDWKFVVLGFLCFYIFIYNKVCIVFIVNAYGLIVNRNDCMGAAWNGT